MSDSIDVDHLISTLSLAQKASLLSGFDSWQTTPLADLGVPSVWLSDGPHGLRREVAHLVSMPATCFPTESALGASWDRDLVAEVGSAIGREAAAQGVSVVLGPGINMKRSPLCGRNFEYFSEDPVHTGLLAAAYVNGVQSRGVGTSLKHFVANNQEHERHWVSAEIDERTLRETYCAAFERVVTTARPWTVMCSYNRLNGTHTSQHRWLLTDLLRTEWGFDGVVISDWWAVHDRVAALTAGLDIEMPRPERDTDHDVVAAVERGEIDEEVVNTAVHRILRLVRQAAHEEPAAPLGADEVDAHHALAQRAAAESIVLLRNEDAILPLDPGTLASLAVVGRFAAEPRIQGGGSADVNPTRVDTLLDRLSVVLPSTRVRYEPGFVTADDSHVDALVDAAVEAAAAAEVVLVCVGLTDQAESEGYDRAHIDLPANQLRVVEEVAATGTPMIVVLTNGSVVSMDPWHSSSAAVVESWLAGQGGGAALAKVLVGEVNPSGKLTETFPLRLADNPSYLGYPGERGVVRYGEGSFIGYRWYDALDLAVRYPFGHGLSYTTFEYSDLLIDVVDAEAGEVHVSWTVTNSGDRAGAEVAQVYVSDPESAVQRPVRELRAFDKVTLEPGGSALVTVRLTHRDFTYYDVVAPGWRREGGEFEITVGASSRDLRLRGRCDLPDGIDLAPLVPDAELADIVRRSSVADRE